MGAVVSEAWVLHQGESREKAGEDDGLQALRREEYSFDDIGGDEVLAEPLFGCWEGNMSHALERDPVDICRLRREKRVVLGNAGVVRVVRVGSDVQGIRTGDNCLLFCNAEPDDYGYPIKIHAFDAPHTMGVLSKQMKIKARSLIPVPADSKHSLAQWAAFSLRYITAWSNWNAAYGCWRLQTGSEYDKSPYVVAWGGGVSFAQLQLAKAAGCKVAMTASSDARLAELERNGIIGIDRRVFPDLEFDESRYTSDKEYKVRYLQSEKRFLQAVRDAGDGELASIFFDHIGAPLFPATLKAMARQGVMATCGWKEGGDMTNFSRTTECISRHWLVHTHYARYAEGVAAVDYAEKNGWLPKLDERIYEWEEIPQLAADYAAGRIASFYPIFRINPA